MRDKRIPVIVVASALSTFTLTSQAYDAGYYPDNPYWQAPDWSGSYAQPQYRQSYPQNNYPAPNVNRPAPPYSQNQYQNQNRSEPPPPPGPYTGTPRRSNEGPSAFYTPGYNPNRDRYRSNNWNNNKFWGRSGPGTWMNPNKGNMERGWDDMINSPSRMGRMPGGWTAPEVTMPNPVDIGDQMQNNVEDLPDQMRNMDLGNDVR